MLLIAGYDYRRALRHIFFTFEIVAQA